MSRTLPLALLLLSLCASALLGGDASPALLKFNGWTARLNSQGASFMRNGSGMNVFAPGWTFKNWKPVAEGKFQAQLARAKDGKSLTATAELSESGILALRISPGEDAELKAPMLIIALDETLAGTSVKIDGAAEEIPLKPAKHEFKHARSYELFGAAPLKKVGIKAIECDFSNLRDFRGLRENGFFEIFVLPSKANRVEISFDLSLAAPAPASVLGARPGGSDPILPSPAEGRNFVDNPSFEGGFSSWAWGVTDIKPDPKGIGGWRVSETTGRSGLKSAEYTVANGFNPRMLCSFPIPTESGKSYTVSFYAKTDKPGAALSVFAQTAIWSAFPLNKRVKPGADWTRFSFSLKAPNPFLRLCFGDLWWEKGSVDGAKIWIDDIQFEEGVQATDFVQKPVLCAVSTEAEGNVFFKGEKGSLKVSMTNTSSKEALCSANVILKDIFGKPVASESMEAALKPWQTSEKIIDISKIKASGLIRIAMEAQSGSFKDSFFGRIAICEPVERPLPFRYSFRDDSGPAIGKIPWLEKLGYGGSLSFSPPSDPSAIDAYEKLNWKHVFTPAEGKGCPVKVFRQSMTEADWSAYLKWVDERVEPFVGMPVWWKTMNEPNCGDYTWTPEDNLRVVKAIHAKVKAANPKALVLTPDPYTSTRNAQNWLERFLAAGGKDYVDALATHTYRARPEAPDLDADIQALKTLKAAYGMEKAPILFTEGEGTAICSIPEIGMSPFRGFFEWRLGLLSLDAGPSESLAAALMSRTLLVCLKNASDVKLYLTWTDDIIDGQPVATLAAVNRTLALLGDANFVKEHVIGEDAKTYVFKTSKGKAVACLWSHDLKVERGEIPPPLASIPLKATGWKAEDFMGNPLKADYANGALSFELGSHPVYIIGDSLSVDELNASLEGAKIGAGGRKAVSLKARMEAFGKAAAIASNLLDKPLEGTLKASVDGKTVAERKVSIAPKESASLSFPLSGAKGAFNAAALEIEFIELQSGLSSKYQDKLRWFAIEPKTKEVKMKGDLSDWSDLTPLRLDKADCVMSYGERKENGAWNGPKDLSTAWRIGYSKEGLHVCAEVSDDKAFFDSPLNAAWREDSLQLYFDLKADGHDRPGLGYDSNDESLWIAKIDGKDIVYRDYTPEWQVAFVHGGLLKNAKTAITRLEGKTVYEILLPPAEVFPIEMKAGSSFGFGLLVNDSDAPGVRKQALSNTEPGSEPHQKPELWPMAILVDK